MFFVDSIAETWQRSFSSFLKIVLWRLFLTEHAGCQLQFLVVSWQRIFFTTAKGCDGSNCSYKNATASVSHLPWAHDPETCRCQSINLQFMWIVGLTHIQRLAARVPTSVTSSGTFAVWRKVDQQQKARVRIKAHIGDAAVWHLDPMLSQKRNS